MKLYDSLGPNPRLVRMFMQEKGIEIPREAVDIMAGENRAGPYLEKNPSGQLPALELDDGRVLAETVVICEYLEDLHPTPPLIGSTPEERAETRMWTRRIELSITQPKANGFRFAEGLPMFKSRVHTIPQAADDLKAIGEEGLPSPHPIVPLLVRDSAETAALVRHLHGHGILATAINYPVVPHGEEEIRFQVSADHTEQDIDTVLAALAERAV